MNNSDSVGSLEGVAASSTNITMTEAQFEKLLLAINGGMRASPVTVPNVTPIQKVGDFSKCNARFDGESSVEAFIDSINTYRECVNVSKDNALKGLPMLLDGYAAMWWQGVKGDTNSWEQAINALQNA